MHSQVKNGQNNDTSEIFMSIPIGSTVLIQQEDGGPWTHGTIIGQGQSQPSKQIIQNTSHQHRKNNYIQQATHQTNTCNHSRVPTLPS